MARNIENWTLLSDINGDDILNIQDFIGLVNIILRT